MDFFFAISGVGSGVSHFQGMRSATHALPPSASAGFLGSLPALFLFFTCPQPPLTDLCSSGHRVASAALPVSPLLLPPPWLSSEGPVCSCPDAGATCSMFQVPRLGNRILGEPGWLSFTCLVGKGTFGQWLRGAGRAQGPEAELSWENSAVLCIRRCPGRGARDQG